MPTKFGTRPDLPQRALHRRDPGGRRDPAGADAGPRQLGAACAVRAARRARAHRRRGRRTPSAIARRSSRPNVESVPERDALEFQLLAWGLRFRRRPPGARDLPGDPAAERRPGRNALPRPPRRPPGRPGPRSGHRRHAPSPYRRAPPGDGEAGQLPCRCPGRGDRRGQQHAPSGHQGPGGAAGAGRPCGGRSGRGGRARRRGAVELPPRRPVASGRAGAGRPRARPPGCSSASSPPRRSAPSARPGVRARLEDPLRWIAPRLHIVRGPPLGRSPEGRPLP